MIHLIVGTAGHIDHGKTALVKALTGVDADRLPEEMRRGMTVDLGFAPLQLDAPQGEKFSLGVVDVPGHERLVRNMLAGAMGIDVAMLVIAANESIQAQTREHLEILSYTGIEHGVIVLTKSDLVDDDWMELVQQEVRQFVATSFLREAPLVCVSARQGTGMVELRQALLTVSQQAAASARRALLDAPFCLNVDRAFTVAGHGTIVTGSVASGRVRVGEEVTIAPLGTVARARTLQSHHTVVDEVQRGQRAAINLPGVSLQQIRRGDVIAHHGLLVSSHCIGARLRFRSQHQSSLRRRLQVRMYLGTAEVPATLRWLQQPEDDAEMLAELCTEQPVACLAGQAVVIRSRCASQTLGGGCVLDPAFPAGVRWSQRDIQQLRQLASPDPLTRLAAALYLNGLAGWDEARLTQQCGVAPAPSTLLERLLEQSRAVRLSLNSGRHHTVHADVLQRTMQRVERLLKKRHQRDPLSAAFPPSALHCIFDDVAQGGLTEAVVGAMRRSGRLVCLPVGIALPEHSPKLSKAQQRDYDQILRLHREAQYQPPLTAELISLLQSPPNAVLRLLELAVAQGHLVRIHPQWYLHRQAEKELLQVLSHHFQAVPFTISELGTRLGISRKYSVPLCEYLDRTGVTIRKGNHRSLACTAAACPPSSEVREES